jgi:hypothetical protein
VTHIFDGLDEWATKLLYMRTDRSIEVSDMKDVVSLYPYLLTKFKEEREGLTNNDEIEDGVYAASTRNAGGYSPGVLGNFMGH